jgi:DNA-binding NarL/FixJ family response regulator
MVGEGRSTPMIAQALRASESSVKQDLQQAMRAVGAHTRGEAFARATALGLLP